jgi:thioredoxin 1
MMEPDLEKVAEAYQGTAIVYDVNVNEQPGVAMQIPVRATPMQVFYYADGTPYVPSDEISLQINFLRYVLTDTDTHVMTVHEGMLSDSQMEMILAELGAEL